MCISSIQQSNGNSIEFFLSTWTRSSSKASQSKFLYTLALSLLLPLQQAQGLPRVILTVIELHWDYNYYQPQTNNKWMVEEIMGIRDKKDKDNAMDDISVYQNQVERKDFGLHWIKYRYWTIEETLDKP